MTATPERPRKGGRYVEDPQTGRLTPAPKGRDRLKAEQKPAKPPKQKDDAK